MSISRKTVAITRRTISLTITGRIHDDAKGLLDAVKLSTYHFAIQLYAKVVARATFCNHEDKLNLLVIIEIVVERKWKKIFVLQTMHLGHNL